MTEHISAIAYAFEHAPSRVTQGRGTIFDDPASDSCDVPAKR